MTLQQRFKESRGLLSDLSVLLIGMAVSYFHGWSAEEVALLDTCALSHALQNVEMKSVGIHLGLLVPLEVRRRLLQRGRPR